MPQIPRRCTKKPCRKFLPCPVHPTSNWANNKSPPLPADWKKRKRSVADRDGRRCKWCGGIQNLELDHIRPRSEGGSDDLWNLQLLCGAGSERNCHKAKRQQDKRKYGR